MVRISPTGISLFSSRSRNPAKAGIMTKLAAQRKPALFTPVKLTIRDMQRGAQQRWGVIQWDIAAPGELPPEVIQALRGMALQFKADLKKQFDVVQETVQRYSEGDYAQEDIEENGGGNGSGVHDGGLPDGVTAQSGMRPPIVDDMGDMEGGSTAVYEDEIPF